VDLSPQGPPKQFGPWSLITAVHNSKQSGVAFGLEIHEDPFHIHLFTLSIHLSSPASV